MHYEGNYIHDCFKRSVTEVSLCSYCIYCYLNSTYCYVIRILLNIIVAVVVAAMENVFGVHLLQAVCSNRGSIMIPL